MDLPDPQTRNAVSLLSTAHDDTIKAYFRGANVRPASRVRIERALRELGLEHLIRPSASPLGSPGIDAIMGRGPIA